MEYCLCGHLVATHTGAFYDDPVTFRLYNPSACYVCGCPQFKLDNLRLIEDLAKERGLV
jgi:hypothetical protein